jgi:catechol 2,3-dioxygenase-like lactoylglutathione lyase family enzyme
MEKPIAISFKKISPMLAVAVMEETLAFYHDVLGFNALMKSPEYSIVERDGQTIHFMKAASEEVMSDAFVGTPKSISKCPALHRFGST